MQPRIRLSVFAALCAWGLALPAAAAPPDADLARATKLYDQLDYAGALGVFQTVASRASAAPVDRATASIYVGLISQTLGDDARSRAAFERAIALDPTVPAPANCSPKVVQLLDDLRAKLAASQKAKAPPKVPPPAVVASTAVPPPPSPWLPIGTTAVGVGGAGLVGGVIALALSGSQAAGSPRGHEYGNVGVGLLIGGAVAAGVGAILWAVSGHASPPAAKADSDPFATQL